MRRHTEKALKPWEREEYVVVISYCNFDIYPPMKSVLPCYCAVFIGSTES